jgi:hypothetical protein
MIFLPKSIDELYQMDKKINMMTSKGRLELKPTIIIDYSKNQPTKFQLIADQLENKLKHQRLLRISES